MESHLALWKKRPEFAKYSQTVSYIRWRINNHHQAPLTKWKYRTTVHSHFSVITDRVECVKRLQSIAYSRDFLGVKTDESKILSIIARYEVQLSTSTSALECTFNVFQTRSSFTNDFSHRDPGAFGELHLMFPLTAMLNHSCFPNIARYN